MLTIIFIIALVWVLWKLVVLGIKAAWGITKIVCTVILLPAVLIGLVCVGLIYVAIPILVVVGIIAVIGGIANA